MATKVKIKHFKKNLLPVNIRGKKTIYFGPIGSEEAIQSVDEKDIQDSIELQNYLNSKELRILGGLEVSKKISD